MNFLTGKNFLFFFIGAFILSGIFFAQKAGRTVTIVGGGSYFWEETAALFPKIPDKEENRVDILVVGIRGLNEELEENVNGELLADTIVVASLNKQNNHASIISIPRDLYVDIPEYGKGKINSAYAIGEGRHYGGGGLQLMKALLSTITDVYIDYAVSIDFKGFQRIIDDLGGIVIYRDAPFVESRQWIYDGREGEKYWRLDDAGWTFYVPEGANVMNSEQALYYARSRYSSSDFDRMRRQQEVISAIKSKALNLGVLANPLKLFNILDTLEDNVRSDMTVSEIQELVGLVHSSKIQDFRKEILSAGKNGLLNSDTTNGAFLLVPKTGDYSDIRKLFKEVVNEQKNSD